ncbi:hypothetical protein M2272_005834 [Mycobacterium frederiksbergense]|uniref:DUF2746 domain-containing protein n=1 Tax=Mycolicibacterium frederiksbergense TaxID=117567 RepID=A0ABT6L886_9MYCO|nr:hypothetical protein [Mycolicibacterium frederiksbergense]MDH6199166.1 hypothetical protein [Mycolicibacterium frederiksbergense]
MTIADGMPDLPTDLAHDWYGLATWLIIAVALVIATWLLVQVKNQVKNSHTTNLRDDLDEQFAALGAKVDGLATTLGDHGGRLNSIEQHLRSR